MFQLKVDILDFFVVKQFVVLSLWGRDFFHIDPGFWVPACAGITGCIADTFTDPEYHAHDACVDLLTDAFYMTNSVQIFLAIPSVDHVNDSINSSWGWALYAIKGEIPPSAASMTIAESQVTIVKDTQPGFRRLLLENAFLLKLIRQQKQRYFTTQLIRMILSSATQFR